MYRQLKVSGLNAENVMMTLDLKVGLRESGLISIEKQWS